MSPEQTPVVYLSCGHVQGRHDWGNVDKDKGIKTCPICLGESYVSQLMMGSEPGEVTSSVSVGGLL